MVSTIGKWNPAWGPEPEWQGPQQRDGHLRWFRISCSCSSEEYLVRGYRGEHFSCARCGREMAVEAAGSRGQRRAPVVGPGDRYGRLVVLEVGESGVRGRRATCRCDCGAAKEVWVKHLRSGATRSCGCLMRDYLAGRKISDAHPWHRSYK